MDGGLSWGAWLVLGLLAGLVVYQAFALLSGGAQPTISQMVWSVSRHRVVVFLAGFLAGHWFWPRSCG